MLKIEFTAQFKKDCKLAVKRGCNIKKAPKCDRTIMQWKPSS